MASHKAVVRAVPALSFLGAALALCESPDGQLQHLRHLEPEALLKIAQNRLVLFVGAKGKRRVSLLHVGMVIPTTATVKANAKLPRMRWFWIFLAVIAVVCGGALLYTRHERQEERERYDAKSHEVASAWSALSDVLFESPAVYEIRLTEFDRRLEELQALPTGADYLHSPDTAFNWTLCRLKAQSYRSELHLLERTGKEPKGMQQTLLDLRNCHNF